MAYKQDDAKDDVQITDAEREVVRNLLRMTFKND